MFNYSVSSGKFECITFKDKTDTVITFNKERCKECIFNKENGECSEYKKDGGILFSINFVTKEMTCKKRRVKKS
ncbi:hypothetical protein M0R04_15935 [Candidatus Dojkabacteria bacterium]|nr:hypothetical protein [Candidatus Dojkabacteria bacterium]